MRLAIDIRSNHRAGIYRYAKGLIGPLLEQASRYETKIGIIYDSYQTDLIELFANEIELTKTKTLLVQREAYLRDDEEVRIWLKTNSYDVYFAVNYIYDIKIDIPVAFVLHDTISLMPNHALSDEDAEASYGAAAVSAVKSAFPSEFGPDRSFAAFAQFQLPRLVDRAAMVFTVSQTSRVLIEQYIPHASGKLHVCRNGVDRIRFSTAYSQPVSRDAAASILFVGMDKPHKRLGDLIDAFGLALRKGASGVLRIVSPRSLAPETIQKIRTLGLKNRTKVEIAIDDHALAFRYNQAMAVCCPSAVEGFGLVALEAAACARPVIASDIGAHRETLGTNATYFKVGDVLQLANHIRAGLTGVLPAAEPLEMDSWATVASSILSRLKELGSKKGEETTDARFT